MRSELPVLGAAVHVNEPEPVPLDPEVMANQAAFEVAVHGQSVEVETCTVLVVPDGGTAKTGPSERL
jgi:hypothetical protein